MDGVILAVGIIASFYAIISLLISAEGTKGIEEKPYYGRKTGTIYTAKKDREKHLV